MIDLLAGFDPGFVRNGTMSLLKATRHTADDRQGIHYGMLRALGISRARDGFPVFGESKFGRLRAAESAGMDVIWDACHFDLWHEPSMVEHFGWIGKATRGRPVKICPMNEPSIVPMMSADRWSQDFAVQMALVCIETVLVWNPFATFVSVDVVNGGGEEQYRATDALVGTGKISTVGINYYPHDAQAPLSDVIEATWKRYGLPVLVSETSWHDGHAGQAAAFPQIRNKRGWLEHCLQNAALAKRNGAVVDGICWYPITDMPSWDVDGEVWSNGLIRQDLSIDPSLAEVLSWRTGR